MSCLGSRDMVIFSVWVLPEWECSWQWTFADVGMGATAGKCRGLGLRLRLPFICAMIMWWQRLSQKPTGVLALSLSLLPCLALSGFDSHLRRPQRGCDLHRTVPISTELFRVTAGKSSRPGPCRCSDSDRRPGPREAMPPASCPSVPSGAFLSSCGVGLANSIRLI